MAKIFKTGVEARKAILDGFKKVHDNVSISLGPKGRLAVIQEGMKNKITKDGYTIARSITLEDPFEEEGAKLARQTADLANTEVGDGTTTSTIVGYAAAYEAAKMVDAGHNPQELKRGMEYAMKQAVEFIQSVAQPVTTDEDVRKIAMVSSNFDENIANIVTEAYNKAGVDGVITIDESKSSETVLDVVDGLRFETGYLSHFFVNNNEKATVEFDRPKYLFIDGKFDNIQKLVDILNTVATRGDRLVVIAEDFDQTVLSTMILNRMNGMQLVAIKAPDFGEYRSERLQDMAALTGATVISEANGLNLESFNVNMLGTSDKIIVNRDKTTIVGKGIDVDETLTEHIDKLRQLIEDKKANGETGYVYEKQRKRLASLTNGIVSIRCGALTETLLKEAKDRIDDAVKAVAASKEEGYIAGGGSVTLAASNFIASNVYAMSYDENQGIEVVKKALKAPIRILLNNAGENAEYIIGKLSAENKPGEGYNLLTREYEDMAVSGILDTAKGARTAIEAGISAGITVALTESVIVNKPEEPANKQQMRMPIM